MPDNGARSASQPDNGHDYGRVAVLMGGPGAERAISLESGQRVYQALRRQGVDAVTMEPSADTLSLLRAEGIEAVFLALHGQGGEDGNIQGLLEWLGLPYTGSGVLASALAMDKDYSKRLWLAAGLPTPEYMLVSADSDWSAVVRRLGLPLFIKPVRGGSSIGVTLVRTAEALPGAWREASRYDQRVLAERLVSGGEYTVSILDGQALPVVGLQTTRPFYDYQAKYQDPDTRYVCPCGLSGEIERDMQSLALQANDCLGARSWGRVDVILDDDGQTWLIEMNTIPGMTEHSLLPMAAAALGIDFDALVLRILDASQARRTG